ncbi:uncharacterized protein ASCRUDRAFT_74420 [Ascoidea rubescens DSM 1968]|uniref:Uncharacterized protein n=1 Tax=Ascoidea rubescens DSM 1968 TaxID=1344418 RepID=A0A1D2VN07_9ASCO|nr:hypothetical protein ASCRUDRAFT_74420 [Ascoidea rubescens DSM 1968]ODV62993.1 hypothetical protein ASCRUDRAFT_74420 [Ascoidea rubescens DSM 1968]
MISNKTAFPFHISQILFYLFTTLLILAITKNLLIYNEACQNNLTSLSSHFKSHFINNLSKLFSFKTISHNHPKDSSIFSKVTQKPDNNFAMEIGQSSLILIGIMVGITTLLI